MKRRAILGVILGSALLMLAWAMPWLALRGELGQAGLVELSIPGGTAAPPLMAFGLAGLALGLALLLAGPVFRRVLAALAVALGAAALWQSALPALDPAAAAAPAIRRATGLADLEAVRAAIPDGALALQPLSIATAVLGSLLLAGAGLIALRGGAAWAGAGRRFEGASAADAAPASAGDRRIAQWDALSHGDDPTDADAEPDAEQGVEPDAAHGPLAEREADGPDEPHGAARDGA